MREFPNASDRESQMGGVTGNQPVAPNLGEPGSVTYGQGNPAVTPEMGRSGAGQAPRQAQQTQRQQSFEFNPDPNHTVTPPPMVSAESVMAPAAYSGSMQYMLSQFIGEYCFVDFLIGTTTLVRKEGHLYQVGASYIVIYLEGVYTVCDFYSIKYATFTNPSNRSAANTSRGSRRTNL